MDIFGNFVNVLKKFDDFSTRTSRAEYWYYVLVYIIISFGIDIARGALHIQALAMVGLMYSLVAFIPTIAVGVRRMHDVGKSGWFILIPIYNLILACTAGDEGDNAYGPNPANTAQATAETVTTPTPPAPTA